MYKDFSKIPESHFYADICIIGAGAAGFTCAVTLLNADLKILILEGGEKNFNQCAADLHKAKIINHPHKGIHEARERIVGGTTTKWGGQALPFMAEDFEARSHVFKSGWPISFQDLEPYYKKAEMILGTDATVSFRYDPWKAWKIVKPIFHIDTVSLFVTKWCKIPNFAIQHGKKIENAINITLLTNANVVELIPNNTLDKVNSVRIVSLNGKEGSVSAKYFIVACGAIESIRLFLASKKFAEKGLGNNNGFVGKYFQDHVAAIVGQLIPKSRKHLKTIFDPFYRKGYKYFPRVKLNPEFAKQKEILHASAQVVFVENEGGKITSLKELFADLRKKKLPDLNKIRKLFYSGGILELIAAGVRWKFQNRGSSPASGPVWLEIHSEQEPSDTSYITLGNEIDSLGMPRVCLHWTISDLTIKTILETALLIKEEFHCADIGNVLLEPWVQGKSNDPTVWFSDVYHQSGGLKMAVNEADGIVDSTCKVFGIKNLYVASSAVFPTSSFSNPTMTIIALSIRICEIIRERIKV